MRIIATVINIVLGFIEFLLGVRFIFKVLGVQPTTSFVSWIYDTSSPFITPFLGVLPNISFGSRSVLELTTLVALIIFGIIAAIVNNVFD
jgi:YggT family protein